MKRTSVILVSCVLLASTIIGTGVAAGKNEIKGSKWKELTERVSALELQNQSQQLQIDDLEARVEALEGGGGGGGGVEPPSPPAPGLVIDQEQLEVTNGLNPESFAPLGQQFTPTADTLGAASLRLGVGAIDTGPVALDATIVVHEGSELTGPTIATAPLTIDVPAFPVSTSDWFSTTFDPAVSLTPGHPYTLELEVSSATNAALFWELSTDNPYPGGCAIFSGEEDCLSDMAFVTWTAP